VTYLIGDRAILRRGGHRRVSVLGLGITFLAVASTTVAQAPPPSVDDLVAKAARQGTLRVIVEVKIAPPGPPSREAIAHAQELLLQELVGTSHRVIRRFDTIPFFGLEVTADALRRLGGSALVASIREDRLRMPQ
jgi:hypothetical protein